MAFSPFIRIRLGPDEDVTPKQINSVQDNISTALGQVLGKDDLDRSLLKKQKLVPSGINYISHTLGRKLQGWSVVRTHGTGTYIQVWDVQDMATSPKLQLLLMASATGTVDLEVF